MTTQGFERVTRFVILTVMVVSWITQMLKLQFECFIYLEISHMIMMYPG